MMSAVNATVAKLDFSRKTLPTVISLCLSASLYADGNPEIYSFRVEPQAMRQALLAYSDQSGVQVLFKPEDVQGLQSQGVYGELNRVSAIQKLLAGSNLEYRFTAKNTMVVQQLAKKEKDADTAEKRKNFVEMLSAAFLSVFTTGGATADDHSGKQFSLEEIVVTAEKREESVHQIPIAISAFSENTMNRAGVTGISDLKQLAPSLQFGQQNGSNTFVSIRGIGHELLNIGAESGVTVAQDGVPFTLCYMFDTDFLDVERVEVLRGPQGTISGRNATGGAINIHSKRPTANFEGGVKATIGNYDHYGTEGYISGPVAGDKILGRLAVRTEKADGWLQNTFLDKDMESTDKVQARASFLLDLADDLEAYLVLDSAIDRSSPVTALDFGRARPDEPGFAETFGVEGVDVNDLEFQAEFLDTMRLENYKGVLQLAWDISPSASLTSTTGYIAYNSTFTLDFDGTTLAGSVFDFGEIDLWQASQEVTLTADLTDRLDVILGGLYLQTRAEEPILFGLPYIGVPRRALDFRAEQDLKSYALYTQWRYRLSDDFRVSIGVRYTHDTKDFLEIDTILGETSIVSDSKNWDALTPRIALDYSPTDDLTLYTSVSRGFKAGGFNTYGAIAGVPNDFAPEFVWNYEAGVKANWLDQRLRTVFTGFYMDYKDMQLSLFRTPEGGGLAFLSVQNAGAATISGVEFEIDAFVSDQFRVGASGTWLDATYDELLTNDPIFPELGEQSYAGNRLSRSPEWQFNISGEYTFSLGHELQAVLRADYVWQDSIFFSLFNHELNRQDSYGLLNLSGTLETDDGRWQLSAFARNVMDKRYFSGIEEQDLYGVKLSRGRIGAPRMYGLSLAYTF